MAGFLLVAAMGAALILIGSFVTRSRINSRWGSVDATSIRLSEGTGVVPKWLSFVVLVGWLAVGVGGIGAVIAAL